MVVYDDYTCYGPYTRKDGRQHVVLTKHSKTGKIIERKTVSYPKYLVERYLNRYLLSSETIDHIDGNFSNNALSNLRVVERALHCRSHAVTRKIIKKLCVICGVEFTTNSASRITCGSKSCARKCTHILGYNKGNNFIRGTNDYTFQRSLVQEIVSVEDANSVKPLVGNTEQGS